MAGNFTVSIGSVRQCAALLRDARLSRGWSQEELSRLSGVPVHGSANSNRGTSTIQGCGACWKAIASERSVKTTVAGDDSSHLMEAAAILR